MPTNYTKIVVTATGTEVDLVKKVDDLGGGLLTENTRYISPDVFAKNSGAKTDLGRELAEEFVRDPAYPQDETKSPVLPQFSRRKEE